ncbi:MAG: UDP-N-acetylmuramoyl-L-alanine--D-glutamate ligase [Gemmatimonadota bacterium]|nr:MAG: UDP-N-acetylmuramoyl-L-alanine--D-glutamate ligase [Gemmatimonadota bacterium]
MSAHGASLSPHPTPDPIARGGRTPLVRPGDAVAVLGLGLSGVAAARLAKARGAEVYASDAVSGERQDAAAGTLREEGIVAETGGHDLSLIRNSDLVVVSPGIPPTAEVRQVLRESETPCVAEIELAYRDLTSRVIGITGTNGKTTTTALCHHILEVGGIDAVVGGNIGTPLSEIALRAEQPDWVVVELSSFQLADTDAFASDIGVLLNLAPDHLDRYPDVAAYYADKRRLFRNSGPHSRWVLNAEDPAVMKLAQGAEGTAYLVSTTSPASPGAYLDAEDNLRLDLPERRESWLSARDLRILGRHNVVNALAAGTVAALAGCEAPAIASALAGFPGLPHRLEPVASIGGVLWVNDSKATNVAATLVAVQAFERPIVLLLGGRHKGEPFAPLIPWVQRGVGVVAFGEAAPRVLAELGGAPSAVTLADSLESAVRAARKIARPGDVVLLSPACSSYDMFRNYEERGNAFREIVQALQREDRGA